MLFNFASDEIASKTLAYRIIKKINSCNKPHFILGLATGSSPLPLYKELIRLNKEGEVSFKNVVTFNLDEYYPISKDDKNSYFHFMHENLFAHIDINPSNIHILNGETPNPDHECFLFEEKIRLLGGIDFQIIGVGQNGHIAFNEPGSSTDCNTRLVTLSEVTLESNSKYFQNSQMPTQALTMGIDTIFSAKEIVCIAWGKQKGKVINNAFQQTLPLTTLFEHSNFSIYLDNEAYLEIDLPKRILQAVNTGKNIINSENKILIFSPHPDDDVIGMGATMILSCKNSIIHVAYQTSGWNGVPISDKEEAANIRKKECEEACKNLNAILHFLNSPFYELSKGNTKNNFTREDIRLHVDLIDKIKPDIVFCIGDINDPNGTHEKCQQIVFSALSSSKAHPLVFLYKGAWERWNIDNVTLCIPFDKVVL